MRPSRWRGIGVLMALLVCGPAPAAAQRGGGGGDLSFGVPASQRTRLDILEAAFALTGSQKDQVEDILDAAHESAAPVREQLTVTRGAISTAVMAGQQQAEIDGAIEAYAAQTTAMASIEMKALAQIVRILTPEQQSGPGIGRAFFLLRGAFLDGRRWNVIPEAHGY